MRKQEEFFPYPHVHRERAPFEMLVFMVAALVGVGIGSVLYLASFQSEFITEVAVRLGLPVSAQSISRMESRSDGADLLDTIPASPLVPVVLPESQAISPTENVSDSETSVIPRPQPSASPSVPLPTAPATPEIRPSSGQDIEVPDSGSIRVRTRISTED